MERGDHIYVRTKIPGVTHHGIYCANDSVIHFDGHDKIIKSSTLEEFSKPFVVDEIAVYYDGGGKSPDIVILRAESLLGKAKYNLLHRNCEHFAVYCRTGKWESSQIETKNKAVKEHMPIAGRLFYTLQPVVKSAPANVKPFAMVGLLALGGIATLAGGANVFKELGDSSSKPPEDDRDEMMKISRAIQAEYPPSPSDQDDLDSEKEINYTLLQDLLKDGKWKAADQETHWVMLRAVGKKEDDYFSSEDLLNFPCVDLQTIDRLWVKYSNGKFGFSVQKQIYVECGAKLDGVNPGGEIYQSFCDHVGWRKEEVYLSCDKITFQLHKYVRPGHLPYLSYQGRGGAIGLWNLYRKTYVMVLPLLLSRIETCEV